MKIFTVTIEIDDLSGSDGEDIEMVLEDIFRENLPEDLTARIIEVADNEA